MISQKAALNHTFAPIKMKNKRYKIKMLWVQKQKQANFIVFAPNHGATDLGANTQRRHSDASSCMHLHRRVSLFEIKLKKK